jgi:hypothetical protein
MTEEELDALTRELYQQRSQSPREMTDERWERIKRTFAGSVRICREDILQQIDGGDLEYNDDGSFIEFEEDDD